MNIGNDQTRPRSVRRIDLRQVAEYYATGFGLRTMPVEMQRLIRLSLNEAEALATQTGLPELVLPSLAEEKVTAFRKWAARQQHLRGVQSGFRLAA